MTTNIEMIGGVGSFERTVNHCVTEMRTHKRNAYLKSEINLESKCHLFAINLEFFTDDRMDGVVAAV